MSESLEGRVKQLLPGGEAVVEAQSHHYLIANALPGETIRFQSLPKRRGALRGVLDQVVQVSEQRVSPDCNVADQCGGCALQFMSYADHAALKSDWVAQAFRKAITSKSEWMPIEEIHVLQPEMMRRRVRWQVSQGDCVSIGFYQRASHQVVRTEHCMVIRPELESLRKCLEAHWEHFSFQRLPSSVYTVECSDGMHVVFEMDERVDVDPAWMPPNCERVRLPIQWWSRQPARLVPLSRPVAVLHDALPAGNDGCQVIVGPDDFVQGQFSGNQTMNQQVQAWSQGASLVVDLFSGIGNLSMPLAVMGCRVRGAEVSASSVRAANLNAKALSVDACYEQVDLFRQQAIDPHLSQWVGADVLVVDPPRKGARQICMMMSRLLPRRVILIHCDIASAERDAGIMLEQGYQLHALRALDLFPFSGHVESMSLWLPEPVS